MKKAASIGCQGVWEELFTGKVNALAIQWKISNGNPEGMYGCCFETNFSLMRN
jgi:hypothetical protein